MEIKRNSYVENLHTNEYSSYTYFNTYNYNNTKVWCKKKKLSVSCCLWQRTTHDIVYVEEFSYNSHKKNHKQHQPHECFNKLIQPINELIKIFVLKLIIFGCQLWETSFPLKNESKRILWAFSTYCLYGV